MMSGIKNRTLFHGDNLDILRDMDFETAHPIATDLHFKKGLNFYATPDSLADGRSSVLTIKNVKSIGQSVPAQDVI